MPSITELAKFQIAPENRPVYYNGRRVRTCEHCEFLALETPSTEVDDFGDNPVGPHCTRSQPWFWVRPNAAPPEDCPLRDTDPTDEEPWNAYEY
jgi:hypothetical protein